jgi:D-alanyl-D-alanine carboxypeptidase
MRLIISILLGILQLVGITQWGGLIGIEQYATGTSAKPAHQLNEPVPLATVAIPTQSGKAALTLGATSSIAIDADTRQVLYIHNADQQLPIASITKMVSALVILRDYEPSQVVTIPTLPVYASDDEKLGLKKGQRFTIHELLQAMLIQSADDSADALALIDSNGNEKAFVAKMNAVVSTWNIPSTHFSNPSGLVDTGNYSTARSLTKIAAVALNNPLFAGIVASPSATIRDTAGDVYGLNTINALLQDSRFSGIKTGYTQGAGQSLVALATVHGHKIITTVLHSPDRFAETTALVDYVQGNYSWQ